MSLNVHVLNTPNILIDLKGPKEKYMDYDSKIQRFKIYSANNPKHIGS